MRKRSIANLLSRNCRRGRDKKWKLPGRPQLRRAHQFRKERKRLSLTPSFQFFNQRLDRVGVSTIRWQHQWLKARCVLPVVRWDDKSCAEFWEEFSEAAVAADSNCRGACVRRLFYSIQWLRTITTALKKNRRVLANTRRFECCLDYFYSEAAGLAAPFFAPLAAFTWTSVADIVYVMVTFSPTLRSPLTLVLESRLISQRSLPFWTAIIESFTSSTGPVTW